MNIIQDTVTLDCGCTWRCLPRGASIAFCEDHEQCGAEFRYAIVKQCRFIYFGKRRLQQRTFLK